VHFPVSGVDCPVWVPPALAFVIALVTAPAGLSGAFLLLPFQMSVLGFTSPGVTPTNLLYNVVAIPGGVYGYLREGRMTWPLTWIVIAGTLPGMLFGAVTLPFAWATPSPGELAALVAVGIIGGLSHIFLTESYRYASASTVAPFEYTALVWGLALDFAVFGLVPLPRVLVGGTIVIAAGVFLIWDEHRVAAEPLATAER